MITKAVGSSKTNTEKQEKERDSMDLFSPNNFANDLREMSRSISEKPKFWDENDNINGRDGFARNVFEHTIGGDDEDDVILGGDL